uniref:Adhesion G-protein coupled receptor G6 n=1 Tax=Denticeps clupeoides TaxID=299321 RepID=A0AAY4AXF9_9TELE
MFFIGLLALWVFWHFDSSVCCGFVLSCQSCNLVLTDPEGGFTSPCYPQNYPPSQSCKWTLQAPAGFVVQITFLDFDLEEAMGCIYDKVIVNMGSSEKKFCGLTANGLTLNSTGNVMEVTFSSDFSVQKKGFRISYKQVAVSLRNQKVTLPQNNKDIVKVASQVTLPTINHLTVCFEIARSSVKDVEMIFTLGNGNGGFALGFGKTLTGMLLYLDGLECNLDGVISGSDFTSSMKPFCLTWTKSTGQVALQFDGSYRTKTCSDTKGHMVKASSVFQLGGGTGSFDGVIYNFRLWSKAMTTTDLSTLSCDVVGDAIDWDNTFWDIPSGYAQTDSTKGCTSPSVSIAEVVFYRISLAVNDAQSAMNETDVEEAVLRWLDLTFQGWTYSVYIDNYSTMIVNICSVTLENCQLEETPLHYKWPESRPTITQYVPCFPYKDQRASRNCSINLQNYTSFWSAPDLSNCQDIIDIEVAVQLKDITNSELSPVEVSKVVTKVKELVNVARINATLATTVVSIISNVMTSSDSAQAAASRIALTAMDDLVQKVEFEGPSVTIFSKNLAVGITALNSSQFNGTSFSAFIPPNTTDPQVDFESEWQNPLAVVSLPATLLHNLSSADAGSASRINFMFFTRTGLFQDNQSNGYTLNSYVVASSVGNLSITNLQDPVVITITHLDQQESVVRTCVFWDFTVNNGTGGWNSEGCRVSGESNANHTVCLCDHLTHFGILMDISGMAAQIDEKNTRILTFITYIGCGVSAIFSAATLLTYIAFESLRRDYPSKILMNLSTSLLFLNMVFLLDSWLASFGIESVCVAAAVFLHFFLLTSFTWMGLESIHMYIALVKVFNTYIRRYILKFCLVGWGLPAAIVGTVVAINKDFYGKEYYGKSGDGKGASEFCWIKSAMVFYVTCVTYFSIIFLVNVAMFIVVMMQICGRNGKRSNRTLREEILRNLRSVFSLTFLLGMTWGFAFFAWGPVNLAFMYLFSIFNSLQGLFVFVFHCALKENVQKQWRRYLCCGKFQLADNSDWSKTATNNTKKVSSDNLGKSLSSSSFGSSTANWTSKAKATLNPFAKRSSNAGKKVIITFRICIMRHTHRTMIWITI